MIKLYLIIIISNLNNFSKILYPWFITGFIDAEGSFYVSIVESSSLKIGWRVQPIFSLTLHPRDLPLLEEIQTYLGKIYKNKNAVSYQVTDLEQLIIIPFLINIL